MEIFYFIAAGGGGALIVCQFLASVFGLIGDHDVDAAHEVHGDTHGSTAHHDQTTASNWFLGMLTFRSIAAAITFFGLGGLTARYYEITELSSFFVALISGCAALYMVAMMMKAMFQLKADGSVRMERAVGQLGRVYLTIPAKKAGTGKVTLNVQNRTVECSAITAEHEIATGSSVKVVALLGPTLVEVAPITDS